MKEYAIYKGEEILAIGTWNEIAKKLNIKKKSAQFYRTPSAHKRNKGNGMIAIEIEEV